ncbi:hypothetical protein BBJ29_008178 [Phytophthora kernoviae]|uniref:ubiquitinyl hydrolase 1 n=1 Tax=Phytophthora kernoviae TaxID=325452 RepID=A0A3R7JGQ4_9STRA|nr:hypothetical protein BBJ29_008178 [Phytophthora kernoviae]
MSYVTKCLQCKNKSMRPSSYYEISLNIKGYKSVEDCIESYLSGEVLEGENKYFCDHCDAKQCAERFLELKPRALPPTLMVQLMRFVYDANAGRKKKLTDMIEINETLNMTELLRRSGDTEAFNDKTDDAIYRLSGYLNHRGKSAHVGHYTASVAYPKTVDDDDTELAVDWFEFDDAVVSDATKTDAEKERSHGKKIRSRDIYMLLYVRDDVANAGALVDPNTSTGNDEPQPSQEYLDGVLALNAAFDAEVDEYASKVSGMETRINKRVDAYKRFFEKSQPYANTTSTDFYWEVNAEMALLKGSAANVAAIVATGSSFLMSRAWISSYKTHLQELHKELLRAASSSKKGKMSGALQNVASPNDRSSGNWDSPEHELWQTQINEDITCVHGNLSLEKRKYRAVAAETWSYFSAKFSYRAEFREAITETCAQCRADDFASKECIQVERDVRDEILSVPALETLYRRKPSGDSIQLNDLFELPPAEHGRGLEKSSSWSKKDAARLPRRMFLVTRRWIAQWREYIRNVEENMPPVLTLSTLLCPHQKLVLPPGLLAAQQGQLVESSSLEVELVTLDEMLALVQRYGDPEVPLYYGLFVADYGSSEDEGHVVWRRCSPASLKYGNEKAVKSGRCPDGVMPLVCQDANDEGITCAECQATSEQRHRNELENFSNRVVNVQQLNDEQPVPTTESLTSDANTTGRRRSKRIRPGSTCTWPVSANATDTVYILKAKIYAEIDALPIRQRLYYKGEMLEDCRTLKQCGIKAGDAVFMRLSEDSADDLVMEETQEREVGFADSVFLSHALSSSPGTRIQGEVPDTSGDQAMAIAMASSHEAQVWVCSACTFVNDDTDVVCEMCSSTKDG